MSLRFELKFGNSAVHAIKVAKGMASTSAVGGKMQDNIGKKETENSKTETSSDAIGATQTKAAMLKTIPPSQHNAQASPERVTNKCDDIDTSPSAVSVQGQIVDGWYQGARYCVSPHFNARPLGEVSLLVIHNISLPAGCFGLPFIDHLFQGCLDVNADTSFAPLAGLEVSAHFLVRRDGECVQYVSCDDRAWHAGVSRYVDNRIVDADAVLTSELSAVITAKAMTESPKQKTVVTTDFVSKSTGLQQLKHKSQEHDSQAYRIRENCNDFAIGIELEGTDTQAYTNAQYTKLAELTAALLAHYPLMNKSRIVGHCDIAPGRKTDPGASFDWQRYLASL